MKSSPSNDPAALRRAAEALLNARPPKNKDDLRRLQHELEVHQIELEMQNAELLASRAKIAAVLERYTELYDFAPVGYLTLDIKGAIVQVNLTGARLLGIERARLVQRRFALFVAEGDRRAFSDFLKRSFASEATESCEVTLTHDGSPPRVVLIEGKKSDNGRECHVVVVDFTARRQSEGEVQRLLALSEQSRLTLLDAIEDQKESEMALRETESRLRLSVTASNIGLWDWNLATNDVAYSREWNAQIGYAEDELPDRFEEWESRVHPDDLAPTLAKIRTFIEDPTAAYAVEFRLRHKDGSWRWIFSQGLTFRDESNKPLRMMGCHIDITERKRAEETLRESHKQLRALAERLQVVREEEAARIARELHDELGGALTTLKIDVAWMNRRAAVGEVATIAERTKATSALIDSTIQSVRRICLELRPAVLDQLGLATAVEWLAKDFERRAGVVCMIECAESVPVAPERALALFRILQEVLTNVARHAHASEVRISLARCDDQLVLEVADDGGGFDEGALTGRKGLGLVGMRERAASAGGSFAIESTPGHGTRVRVSVPAGTGHATEEES